MLRLASPLLPRQLHANRGQMADASSRKLSICNEHCGPLAGFELPPAFCRRSLLLGLAFGGRVIIETFGLP